jgi:hypothetical protein
MKILEFHRTINRNVGDRWCNPSRYFKFKNLQTDELARRTADVKDNIIIIGGGGLIHKKFSRFINEYLDKGPRLSVLWGVGHNFNEKHLNKTNSKIFYPEWLSKISLVGIRDWIDGHHESYLPCVSCMHPAFDKKYTIKHDIVYFTHTKKSNFKPERTDIHMMNNNVNIDEVIEFLGSAKTIVTDSYHGAYWGQLLRKDVKVVSWSTKFRHLKYQPTFIKNINEWKNTKESIVSWDFLEESRTLNQKFYKKYLELEKSIL